MVGDLPDRLRALENLLCASGLNSPAYVAAQGTIAEAADALEREAVSPDTLENHGWTYDTERKGFTEVEGANVPLIPWPSPGTSRNTPEHRAYHAEMVSWVRAVTATERSHDA